MNKKDITAIVDELITLEPSLAKHKAMLEKQVTAIVSAKPDTKFTQSFKKKLLSELRTNLVAAPSTSSPVETMNKWFYAIGGAAVASFALYITVIHPVVPMPLGESDGAMEETGPAMQRMAVRNKAMNTNEMALSDMPTPEPSMANPRPQSGGGGDMVMGYGGGGGIPPMADSRMIAPGEPYGYTAVEFVYDGDIELPESNTIEAVRRMPLEFTQKADVLSNTFVSQMLNVSKLKSLNMVSVTLRESGNEPLMVNVDFNDGSIGINRQIDYSKRPEHQCRDEACYNRYRMRQSDMLSEDRTLSIASSFLEDLGVDTSSYGEPVLQDDWRARYEMSPDSAKASFYFPEQTTVTFPYIINDTPVLDEWGNPSGVSVSVDYREKAALGVWGLRTMNFETTEFATVTDEALLRDVIRTAHTGGHAPEYAEVKQAQLAEPRMVYVSHYYWNDDTQESYETYVPALAFPVLSMPEGSYETRRAVVVPLAQELLEEKRDRMPPYPMPMPMPVEPLMDPPMMEKEMMMEGQAG